MGASLSRIDKIDDGFFICGVTALEDVDALHKLGIRYILNVGQQSLYTRGRDLVDKLKPFKVKIMGANDSEIHDLSVYFNDMSEFIDAGRKEGGVVVHCAAGISRSSTACLAYLMMKEHLTLRAAFRKVHEARIHVMPNTGFWRQLRSLEQDLQLKGKELREPPFDENRQLWQVHNADEEGRLSMSERKLWEVIGGAEKGGIIVRDESKLSSAQKSERLSFGSIVSEVELLGERLHYQKVLGMGPMKGWISIALSSKTLAKRVSADALTLATIRKLDHEANTGLQATSLFVVAHVMLSQKCGSVEEAASELLRRAPPDGLVWQAVQPSDGRMLVVRAKLSVPDMLSENAGDEVVRRAVVHTLGSAAVESVVVERLLDA